MEKLLLHVCCAPCSIVVIDSLKDKYELITYFYNPNIHPFKEYKLRVESFKNYMERLNLKYLIGKYNYKDYFSIVDNNIENRCIFCYQLRLNEVTRKAKDLEIKNFSTTMIYSIYQKHDLILKVAKNLEKVYDLNFIYFDFREKYILGKNKAKEIDLYIQKYCGCVFSEIERFGGVK